MPNMIILKIILYLILAFIALNVLFFLILALISATAKKQPISEQKPIYRWACFAFSAWACFIGRARLHITGEEKIPRDSRFVYCSNHRGLFDPLSANVAFRKHNISFISKPSNMNLPVIGRLAWAAGYLPIDRENDRNALRTIVTASKYIEKDLCSIGIYPEGTRSKINGLLPFKHGSFKLAQKAKVPLVIAASRNADTLFDNFPLRPTDIYIDILDVVPVEKVCSMSSSELSDYAWNLINEKIYG